MHNEYYILEYFGMMDDPKYRAKNAEKIRNYINAGYIPDETIMFIYDFKDGTFNAQRIEQRLREWAGIH